MYIYIYIYIYLFIYYTCTDVVLYAFGTCLFEVLFTNGFPHIHLFKHTRNKTFGLLHYVTRRGIKYIIYMYIYNKNIYVCLTCALRFLCLRQHLYIFGSASLLVPSRCRTLDEVFTFFF